MRTIKRSLSLLLMIGLSAGVLAIQPVYAGGPPDVESPPEGISPSEFATEDQGCLGALRSAIAQGEFDGVGPFGERFTGDVNPGAHQGTVGEEEFLINVIGIEDVEAFCDMFE